MFTCLLLFAFVCFCLFLLASLIFGYRCKEWSFYLIIVMRRQKARRHMAISLLLVNQNLRTGRPEHEIYNFLRPGP